MPRKLLLADDSITIQKVIEIILAQEDFEIKSVGDGEEAVKALTTFRPDIVLADVGMPLIDGYQLCEKIRGNPALAHVPVVLLAGAFEPYDEARANAAGAKGVLIKPFESKELVSKIRSVMSPPAEAVASDLKEPKKEPVAIEQVSQEIKEHVVVAEKAADVQILQPAPPPAVIVPALEEFRKNVMDERTPPPVAETLARHEEVQEQLPPKTVTAEAAMPDKEEILKAVERTVDQRVADALRQLVVPDVTSAVKEYFVKEMSARIPSMMEGISRDLLTDLTSALRPEIERHMKTAVPEVAEALIRKEIEKITSEG